MGTRKDESPIGTPPRKVDRQNVAKAEINGQKLNVDCTPVVARIGYQDLRLLVAIGRGLLDADVDGDDDTPWARNNLSAIDSDGDESFVNFTRDSQDRARCGQYHEWPQFP